MKRSQFMYGFTVSVLVGLLCLSVFLTTGCKKDEPATEVPAASPAEPAAAALTCPKCNMKAADCKCKAAVEVEQTCPKCNMKAADCKCHAAAPVEAPAAAPAETPAEATEAKFINSLCPIMGTKIVPANVPENLTREFGDKKVAFCCAGCPAAWDKLTDEVKQEKLDALATVTE